MIFETSTDVEWRKGIEKVYSCLKVGHSQGRRERFRLVPKNQQKPCPRIQSGWLMLGQKSILCIVKDDDLLYGFTAVFEWLHSYSVKKQGKMMESSYVVWLSGKEFACQCRRHGFNSWVGKISWRRKWQPIPVFLPGKSLGQRSLVGYSSGGHKRVGQDLMTKLQTSVSQTLICHSKKAKYDSSPWPIV